MGVLPGPPPSFIQKKCKILDDLAVPDTEYTDASPKGSVDVGIRDLINEINKLDGFVTTSSCAGRVSIFVEGRKAPSTVAVAEDELGDFQVPVEPQARVQVAGVGGKGGGGNWLYVSHEPLDMDEKDHDGLLSLLGLGQMGNSPLQSATGCSSSQPPRLIHFKFEPMILHILTASLEHAHLLLKCGLHAGFRESGAVSLTSGTTDLPTPMVAVRTMGLAFESLVGIQDGDRKDRIVSFDYIRMLISISNERFVANQKRIERFRVAVKEATEGPKANASICWEDAGARRERKRAEGLRRKAELQAQRPDVVAAEDAELNLSLGVQDT